MGADASKGCLVSVDLGPVSIPVALGHPVDFRALQSQIRTRAGIPEVYQLVLRVRNGLKIQMCAEDPTSLQVRRGDSISVSWRRIGGRHPLHFAAADGNVGALMMWLQGGSEVDVRDDDGRTPLISAAQSGRAGCLEALLAAGADVDAATHAGWTALHWAAYWRQEVACTMLCAAGASPQLAGNEGETPLSLAGNDPRVVAVLRAAGARSTTSLPPLAACATTSKTSLPTPPAGSSPFTPSTCPSSACAPAGLSACAWLQLRAAEEFAGQTCGTPPPRYGAEDCAGQSCGMRY